VVQIWSPSGHVPLRIEGAETLVLPRAVHLHAWGQEGRGACLLAEEDAMILDLHGVALLAHGYPRLAPHRHELRPVRLRRVSRLNGPNCISVHRTVQLWGRTDWRPTLSPNDEKGRGGDACDTKCVPYVCGEAGSY